MSSRYVRRAIAALVLCVAVSARGAEPPTAIKAKAFLEKHCFECHGKNGSKSGRIDYITDLARLKSEGKVIASNPKDSLVWQLIESAEMPPELDKKGKEIARPSSDETKAVKDWIAAGAPTAEVKPRTFVGDAEIYDAIARDLRGLEAKIAERARYFIFTNLYNSGGDEVSDGELELMRMSFSQILNSLSWNNRGDGIVPPKPIDDKRLIYRIDFSDYTWTKEKWDALTKNYRWGSVPQKSQSTVAEIQKTTQAPVPAVRADWFMFVATRPPFYHDLLSLPTTLAGLEKLLNIDTAKARREATKADRKAARAGIHGYPTSGVAIGNRVLERVPTIYGAYWRSYDFKKGVGRKDIFQFPLGPEGTDAFQPDGGEVIFNLPNGLQAYLLVDAAGKRIDVAPTDVVFDPARPTGIVNGISCMTCHNQGMRVAKDEILAAVLEPKSGFNRATINSVDNLYASQDELDEYFKKDSDKFRAAREKAEGRRGLRRGADDKEAARLSGLIERFERNVSLSSAAAEFGLTTEEFKSKLDRLPDNLKRQLASLRTSSLPRDRFQNVFNDLVGQFGLNQLPAGRDPQVASAKPTAPPVRDVKLSVTPTSSPPRYGAPGVYIEEVKSGPPPPRKR